MNVLFTSEEIVDLCCDGGYYSRNLPQHLMKYEYFGNVICACYKNEVDRSTYPICDKKYRYEFFPKENKLSSLVTTKCHNRTKMKKLVQEADLIIAHVPSALSRHAIALARKYRKPYFVVVVGCPFDSKWNYDWRGKLLAPHAYLKQRAIVAKAPYALYVTRDFLQHRYPCKGITENASNVWISKAPEQILTQRLDRIDNYKHGDILKIATTAAIDVPYKGQQYVIAAMQKLVNEHQLNLHYYIIGGGDQSFLKATAEEYGLTERVHFTGALKPAEVIATLDEMDLYIQPSKQEGLPRALIEAMSRAIPSFGSRIAGIPELLQEDCLFQKGNIDEIVDVVCRSLTTDNLKKMATTNYESSCSYVFDVINERRNAFFDKIINNYKLIK